jgi:hypothetical protein
MAHHLMGIHLAPKRTGLRMQALKPIQQVLNSGGIECLHLQAPVA